MRIFFLEDDYTLRSNYIDLFHSEGHEVFAYNDYKSASKSVLAISPDFAVLDIELPDDAIGGIKICRMLRKHNRQIPIIFLTSHTELDRQAQSWRAGADDYVTKDTHLELVLLRIRALAARYDAILTAATRQYTEKGDLFMDQQRAVAFWKGRRLDLSLTQYWMLSALVLASGEVINHESLQRAANIVVEPNTVAAYIKSIRDAFKEIDESARPILTERGKGYRWIGNTDTVSRSHNSS